MYAPAERAITTPSISTLRLYVSDVMRPNTIEKNHIYQWIWINRGSVGGGGHRVRSCAAVFASKRNESKRKRKSFRFEAKERWGFLKMGFSLCFASKQTIKEWQTKGCETKERNESVPKNWKRKETEWGNYEKRGEYCCAHRWSPNNCGNLTPYLTNDAESCI